MTYKNAVDDIIQRGDGHTDNGRDRVLQKQFAYAFSS